MRALFVNENIGGHATVHLHLEEALRHISGVEARFLHLPAPGVVRRIAALPVPGLARLDLDLQPLRYQLAQSVAVRRLLRSRSSDAYDVMHVYTQNAALLSADFLRRSPGVVSLDTTNSLNAYRLPYRRPTRWTPWALKVTLPFEHRVYAAATLIVAQSEWARASLVADYGVGPEKIRVTPFGISAPDGDPAAPDKGCPRITFVGTTMGRKGGFRLLDAYERHLRDRASLTLITPEDVSPRPGVMIIGDIHTGDRRLWEILRASAIFAFPSEIDQAPNVVFEAMAAGLPVVGVRTGAVPEMVEHGVTGLLTEPGDDAGLVGALRTLVDNPGLRARMGAAGRARFEQRFEARGRARALVSVLEEAIELWHGRTRPGSNGDRA